MAGDWSDDEIAASVAVYNDMLMHEKNQTSYNKKKMYRDLAAQFGRTEKAFEYRMQNISHVLHLMEKPWVKGLKPAKNVGSRITSRIEKQLLLAEGRNPNNEPQIFVETALLKDFDRDKNGVLSWPFPTGADVDDREYTTADLAEWDRQYRSSDVHNSNPPTGAEQPTTTARTRNEYVRSLDVVNWVIQRCAGKCECCEKPAPFSRQDGSPFLEVHHIRQLANGGSDRVSNAIAVCPNCHRELHFGSKSVALIEQLYERVKEIQPE